MFCVYYFIKYLESTDYMTNLERLPVQIMQHVRYSAISISYSHSLPNGQLYTLGFSRAWMLLSWCGSQATAVHSMIGRTGVWDFDRR